MKNTTNVGNAAEELVLRELLQRGHQAVAKNWKTKQAEIDVITLSENTLYFTEVKYRRSDATGDGFDYITAEKLRRMHLAALSYIRESNWKGSVLLQAASVIGHLDNPVIDIREL